MSKTIAITGATGYVGRFVVPHLRSGGFRTRCLARPASDRSGFPLGTEWVVGHIEDSHARKKLVSGAHAVVHLAYSHVPGRYRGGEGSDLATWLHSNLSATVDLLLDAHNANVEQFIFLSSRAVFSYTEAGRILDESHPTSPDTHYGAYKAAVESLLRGFSAVEGIRTTSIRATGVYGVTWPVERSKWWSLINDVLENKPLKNNRGGTEVHGSDVARTIMALIQRPADAPDVVHLSDLYVTNREIVEIARSLSGHRGPLPPPPDDPASNVLSSSNLHALGIQLGGKPLLVETIRKLVQLALNPQTA